MVKYKQFLYVYGGCDDDGYRLGDISRYSLSERSWQMIKIVDGDIPIVSYTQFFDSKLITLK